MSEQRSREAPEGPAPIPVPDEVNVEERPRPKDEFRSYSLDLLAVLEG
jgi:hypothetical protein